MSKQEEYRSKYCIGEKCYCGNDAYHKIEEVIFDDDTMPYRHPLTRYVCKEHFRRIMQPSLFKDEWFLK